jgi:diacylglycerol kinase (ATP)
MSLDLEPRRGPQVGRLPAPAGPRPRRAAPVVVGREVRLLVNARASGAGGVHEVLARATGALRAAGARVDALLTADEGELAAAVREAGDRRVVLVGGDGTVHAYANLGLRGLPPAALLPAGRANKIAHALGIPTDWNAAAELAVRGRPAAVDALEVTTPRRRLFALEGVSAGFHAGARHRYRGENSADLAQGVRALVTELAAFRPHHLVLRADGVRTFDGPAAQLFLSNLPLFGFGFRVDPVADPGDGRLEAIVLQARTRRDVVRLLAAARQGNHLGREDVRWSRATRVQLESPLPLVADAQPLGVTTATVTVATGRLRLIAPGARS